MIKKLLELEPLAAMGDQMADEPVFEYALQLVSGEGSLDKAAFQALKGAMSKGERREFRRTNSQRVDGPIQKLDALMEWVQDQEQMQLDTEESDGIAVEEGTKSGSLCNTTVYGSNTGSLCVTIGDDGINPARKRRLEGNIDPEVREFQRKMKAQVLEENLATMKETLREELAKEQRQASKENMADQNAKSLQTQVKMLMAQLATCEARIKIEVGARMGALGAQ
jgi:hypothetical protein